MYDWFAGDEEQARLLVNSPVENESAEQHTGLVGKLGSNAPVCQPPLYKES